jgi:3-deoxy-D-manno-octulosonate 8-phosphate phosphatase (KDO 8-P phosphatase)
MDKARRIRLAVFDVDGVMTDGRLHLGPDGAEFKSVHIHDGLGLQRLQAVRTACSIWACNTSIWTSRTSWPRSRACSTILGCAPNRPR